MRRWIIAFAVVLFACVPILRNVVTSPFLLRDGDMQVLLAQLHKHDGPWVWFTGDWPLGNHFYRPISTLSFWVDNQLHAGNSVGYGWTNALLCVASVLLLFWFIRELTDRPLIACLGAVLFAYWHVGMPLVVFTAMDALALMTLIVGALRHRRNVWSYVPAWLALGFLATELSGIKQLQIGMLGWLPGRTASVMTAFALASMAAYARYERTSASRRTESFVIRATDLPATRTTRLSASRAPRFAVLWVLMSVTALVFSLGAYEQAVMLPLALAGVAGSLYLQGFRPRVAPHVVFWCVLIGYVVLRSRVIPLGQSSYQSLTGTMIALEPYVLPLVGDVRDFLAIQTGGLMWLSPILMHVPGPYGVVLAAGQNVAAVWAMKREWSLALTGYGLSIVAFLPMAFVRGFDRDHYWPMAMRSLFVAMLGVGSLSLVATAWSPRQGQAPPRPSPAPGSLLRP